MYMQIYIQTYAEELFSGGRAKIQNYIFRVHSSEGGSLV